MSVEDFFGTISDTLDTAVQNIPTGEPAPESTLNELTPEEIKRRKTIRIVIVSVIVATALSLIYFKFIRK